MRLPNLTMLGQAILSITRNRLPLVDPETLGLLASIGIEKGKPFAPDDRMKKILVEASAVGNVTARAIAFRPRNKDVYYYPNSAWFSNMPGGSYEFLSQPGVRN